MPKSAQKRQSGTRKGTGIKGRTRKDGLPPIQKGQRALILGESEPAQLPAVAPANPEGEIGKAGFEVVDADSVKESMETNGAALVNDAYRRAARLSTGFDQAVYLTLLGKAHPMASLNQKDKGLPGSKKKQLKVLERLIAGQMDVEDGEYKTITGPDGPTAGVGEDGQAHAR